MNYMHLNHIWLEAVHLVHDLTGMNVLRVFQPHNCPRLDPMNNLREGAVAFTVDMRQRNGPQMSEEVPPPVCGEIAIRELGNPCHLRLHAGVVEGEV
jgi:hypothetical protein